MTKRRIRDWYDAFDGDVYLSFSGGKDSTVLKSIIDDMGLNIPAVFIDTGLEYPEIRKFAKSQENVITVRPKMDFREVITKYGYPIIGKEIALKLHEARTAIRRGTNTRTIRHFNGEMDGSIYDYSRYKYLLEAPFNISNLCCDKTKKAPAYAYEKSTGRKPIVASLADESYARRQKWLQFGCNAFDMKRPRSAPMSFWTEQDVLYYIASNRLLICSVYGEVKHATKNQHPGQIDLIDSIGYEEGDKLRCTGCQRTGCVFCGFGCHLDKEPNRFQRLKITHPKHWEYCIGGGEWNEGIWQPNDKGLGFWYVLDYINVKYE